MWPFKKKPQKRNKFLDTLDSYSSWIRKNLGKEFDERVRDLLVKKEDFTLSIIPTNRSAWSDRRRDLGNIKYVDLFMDLVNKHLECIPYNLPKVELNTTGLFSYVELKVKFTNCVH